MQQKTFLGHPIGLSVLFGTEMWERFCYYGNNAIITYYLVDFLLVGGEPSHVIGYASVKRFFEWLYGPLAAQPLAALIVGSFGSATYLGGLAGGAIADRFLGQSRAVLLGAAVMAVGEFMLADPALFFVGLLVFTIGVSFLKPNIATQVGGLYAAGDSRVDRAYSIFYIGINLGALIAPLVVGRLGHAPPGAPPRWHYGFAVAGAGMLVGLLVFLVGLRWLPPDVRARRREAAREAVAQGAVALRASFTSLERRTVLALFAVAFCNIFFWACYGQQYSALALMAKDYTDLSVGLFSFHPEDVQAFNPFFIFTMTPVVIAFWTWQSKRRVEPAPVTKMAMGCGLTALCFGLLIVPALSIDAGHKISVLWLVAALALQTLGELYLMPVALSLFSKAAPPRLASIMMAVNYMSLAIGFYFAGYLTSFWSGMGKTAFFSMIAGIALATAAGILGLSRILNPMLRAA